MQKKVIENYKDSTFVYISNICNEATLYNLPRDYLVYKLVNTPGVFTKISKDEKNILIKDYVVVLMPDYWSIYKFEDWAMNDLVALDRGRMKDL